MNKKEFYCIFEDKNLFNLDFLKPDYTMYSENELLEYACLLYSKLDVSDSKRSEDFKIFALSKIKEAKKTGMNRIIFASNKAKTSISFMILYIKKEYTDKVKE